VAFDTNLKTINEFAKVLDVKNNDLKWIHKIETQMQTLVLGSPNGRNVKNTKLLNTYKN